MSPFDRDFKSQDAPEDPKIQRLLAASKKSRKVCAESGKGWGTGTMRFDGTPDRPAPTWMKAPR